MAGDASSGAADRSGSGETGRPDDPWHKIESERPERETARKAWDAENDPSPEFEYAARPLDNDYGRDRPRHRELTADQRADLEEAFGRPADELLALRETDPRAGHNRDEQGRILDHDGNPRPERTPEHILREAERQARLYGPGTAAETTEPSGSSEQQDPSDPRTSPEQPAQTVGEQTADQPDREPTEDSPELQAPSDTTDESTSGEASEPHDSVDPGSSGGEASGGDNDGPGSGDGGNEAEEPNEFGSEPEPNQPEDLGKLVGEIAADLRSGKLTVAEAANRLEQFRDSAPPPTASEPTTDTVRTEHTPEGERRFQRDTPVETAGTSGERTATEQNDAVSIIRRRSDEVARSSEGIPNIKAMAEDIQAGAVVHRLPPGARGETTIRQPDTPIIETRHTGEVDAGNVIAAGLAVTIAIVVSGQRLRDKISSRSNQQEE